MNAQISWDASLVKKFSSSNHFKLLNQLRNEIKKYPLPNRNYLSKKPTVEKKSVQNSNTEISNSKDILLSRNSNYINETDTIKSTISFNNSKNFSIYNNKSNQSNNKLVIGDSEEKLNSNNEDST